MYAIKFFHGYLTADGKRTRDKSGCLVYHSEKEAQKLADIVVTVVSMPNKDQVPLLMYAQSSPMPGVPKIAEAVS